MRRETHAAAPFRAHHATGLEPRSGIRGGFVHQPEGDDAGAPLRLRRAEHLGAAVAQGFNSWLSTVQRDDAQILKQGRLLREERQAEAKRKGDGGKPGGSGKNSASADSC